MISGYLEKAYQAMKSTEFSSKGRDEYQRALDRAYTDVNRSGRKVDPIAKALKRAIDQAYGSLTGSSTTIIAKWGAVIGAAERFDRTAGESKQAMKRGVLAKQLREAARTLEARSQTQNALEDAIDGLNRCWDLLGEAEGAGQQALMAARNEGKKEAQRFAQQGARAMDQAGKLLMQADQSFRQAWEKSGNPKQ